MTRYILLTVFLFAHVFCAGQNAVINPGFEQYVQCPDAINQVERCVDWWKPAFTMSPEYFNSCGMWDADVPQNFAGYQFAATGQAYAGLVTYYQLQGYREYICGKLTALQPGLQYQVSMRVSLSDNTQWASDGLGIYFGMDSMDLPVLADTAIALNPQIDYNGYGVLLDSVNWVTLTDTFTADSAYQFMTIGNFHVDTLTTLVLIGNNPQDPGAYYYIDDVSVTLVLPAGLYGAVASLQVSAYPNPFSSGTKLTFANPARRPYDFTMYDMQGRVVRKVLSITSDNFTVARDNLADGVYYYDLSETEGSTAYRGKLIIQ